MVHLTRQTELRRLSTLIERQGLAVVLGRPGSGRTSLLQAVEDEWTGHTVHIPYNSREAATRFAGLEILLTALSSAEVEGPLSARGPVADDMSEATAADWLIETLGRCSFRENTLVVIPNVDEMDAPSLAVLGRAVRRLPPGRLRFAVSARMVAEDSPLAGLPRVELAGLRRQELIDLAGRLCHGDLSAEAAELAADAACGRPHALGLILADMTRVQRRGEATLTIPARISGTARPMVEEILDGLDGAGDELLSMLAAAPLTPFRVMLTALPAQWDVFEELQSRGIVEHRGQYLTCADGLVRAVVHATSGYRQRVSVHERLAELCEPVDHRLTHWHLSFLRPTEDTAETLLRDGLGLLDEGQAWAGIEFIERAVRICADPGSLTTGLLDASTRLLDLGELAFAARYARSASETDDPVEAVRARTLRVRLDFLEHGLVPSPLFDIWSTSECADAPIEVARLQLELAHCHLDRGDFARVKELLDASESCEVELGRAQRQLRDSARAWLDARRGDSAPALRLLTEIGEQGYGPEPLGLLAVAEALILTEDYQSARAALGVLTRQCPRDALWRVRSLCLGAEIAWRIGLFTQISEADAAVEAAGSRQLGCDTGRVLLLRCRRLLVDGRAGDAESVGARLTAHAAYTHNRRLQAKFNALEGFHLLRIGATADAIRYLHRSQELTAEEVNANVHRIEVDLIEALVRVGRREHAGLVLTQLKRRAERVPSRWAELAVARSEALIATGERSLDMFARILGSWQTDDSQFELGVTHAGLARRLSDLGQGPKADEQRTIAEGLLREVGADHFIETPKTRASSPSVEHGPTRPELFDLTEDELTIVELVRVGMKNREIARRVFVSLRTVELRLTAVYRKLDVSSRTELVARLAGSPRPSPV